MKPYLDVLRLTCCTLKWLCMNKVVCDDFLHVYEKLVSYVVDLCPLFDTSINVNMICPELG